MKNVSPSLRHLCFFESIMGAPQWYLPDTVAEITEKTAVRSCRNQLNKSISPRIFKAEIHRTLFFLRPVGIENCTVGSKPLRFESSQQMGFHNKLGFGVLRRKLVTLRKLYGGGNAQHCFHGLIQGELNSC